MICAHEVGVRVDCAFCRGLLVLVLGEGSLCRPELPVDEGRNCLVGWRDIESSGVIALAGLERSLVP